jgi:hypothetical protein
MKIAAEWPDGPPRPVSGVRGVELACWLAAAVLALALALTTAPHAGASVQAFSTTVRTEDPQLLIFQRRCIESILGRAAGKTEESVADQINQQCMVPRPAKPSVTRLMLLPCDRPFTVRLTPVAKQVAGCLGG